jgi:ribonucleoside-diphosphate reductase alpha chain
MKTTKLFSSFLGFDALIQLDNSRDILLTNFGKTTLKDRYLNESETFQELFGRVAAWYSDNQDHAQRIYDYLSLHWFMAATPVLSNAGSKIALPISCYLNTMGDSLQEIAKTFDETFWLSCRGGGIGTSYSNIRSIGEKVSNKGVTSGIIPFIHMQDSSTLAISQGNLRRGSSAAYLHVTHPEIEEFIDMRRPMGDPNRQNLNIHNAVVISDLFMNAVENDSNWSLISPKDGATIKTIKARDLWIRILKTRIETGEPYLWFENNVNKARPETYKKLGLKINQSNLCNEIALTTGLDHLNQHRTAVCCLSSVNMETYDQWRNNEIFVEDVLRFLDNVLTDFINKTDNLPGFERARYSAMRERSVGLGLMGFHSFLQGKKVPFESVIAKSYNKKVWSNLKIQADLANKKLADERGACPDALEAGIHVRLSNMFAIAPTASISIIAGGASACIEPIVSNIFKQKTLSGSFTVKNKYLEALLQSKTIELLGKNSSPKGFQIADLDEWNKKQWASIIEHNGSVQHLDYLTVDEKDTFKTAFEIDQRWIIEHAVDRQEHICQGQSLNLFLPTNISKKLLSDLHFLAWRKGLKGLYYCRSTSVGSATKLTHPSHISGEMPTDKIGGVVLKEKLPSFDECLACQ